MQSILSTLFQRDLNKLVAELELYTNEKDIWRISGEISNSAGNLALHIIGNLNHFIGATLGDTGYIRDRDREFTEKDVARDDLIFELKKTSGMLADVLGKASDEVLDADFPFEFNNTTFSTRHMLIHFLAHLNYHLGQVNYHRRMLN